MKTEVEEQRITEEIKEQTKEWLENDEIDYLIGYERGTGPLARPFYVRSEDDISNLIWDKTCVNNLTQFLIDDIRKEEDSKVGVVVKPCDSKAIVELIRENVLPRERIKVIGVTCEGVVAGEDQEEADKCEVCMTHNPVIADVVLGDEVVEENSDDYEDVVELTEGSLDDKREFWQNEVSRCIRCSACIKACPLCYCEECIFEREKPHRWIDRSVTKDNNLFFHMIRGMHLAGRCIDCGECERSCPMDISLRKINRFLEKRVKERFDVVPGKDFERKPLFACYDERDPEEVIV